MKTNFDTERHRGCRGLMPENTIPAMLHATNLDVTTREMDTHITKDLQVVISHDPWFNPDITTKHNGSCKLCISNLEIIIHHLLFNNSSFKSCINQ